MKLCIYRGTNEIGGNCVEIASKKTRILMDAGIPLISMEQRDVPLDEYRVPCSGLYKNCGKNDSPVNAIFISHGHPDHYGMLPIIDPKIPVYMSKTLHQILLKIQPLLPGKFDISHLDIRDIEPNETVKVGDVYVTARAVDHAPAAFAYEIEHNGKRVVYTGDIRFHSNQKYKSWNLAKKAKNPDYLIMEGTRLSRPESREKYPTENAVCRGIKKLIANSGKLTFISLSSQNLDRLVSVIKACRATGKTFVIDPYTAALFDIFHELSPNFPRVGDVSCVRIYYGVSDAMAKRMKDAGLFYTHKMQKITKEEIADNPDKFVIKYNLKLAQYLVKNVIKDYDFIYSMWHGYMERSNMWNRYKKHLTEIHTSGHAAVADLQKFVKRIKPKNLVPIHTECKNEYVNIFKGQNVIVLDDNKSKRI